MPFHIHARKLTLFSVLIALLGICSPHRVYSQDAEILKPYIKDTDLIRVGITKNGLQDWSYNQMDVSSPGDFSFWDPKIQRWAAIMAHTVLRIGRQPDGSFQLLWQNPGQPPMQAIITQTFQVRPNGEERLVLPSIKKQNKMPEYRGIFEIMPDPLKTDKYTLVNILTLQDYLKGVVPNELGYSFGVEAVKTQAVLARNYAINPRDKTSDLFDICDTEYCQAYYGANTEDDRVNNLLQQTTDIVALYNGSPILALYSSTHGGISENVENVFGGRAVDYPYLRGRTDFPTNIDFRTEEAARWFYTSKPHSFDENSPLFRWERQWDGDSAYTMIRNNISKMTSDNNYHNSIKCNLTVASVTSGSDKNIKKLDLSVLQRGYSGKILSLQVAFPDQVCTVQKEYTIRKLFEETNGKALPSANFVTNIQKNSKGQITQLTLDGGGFGHGVGLSQYGAGWLAKKGWSFPRIIQNYYHGVSLGTIPVFLSPDKSENILFFGNQRQAILKIKPLDPNVKLSDYPNYQLDYKINSANGSIALARASAGSGVELPLNDNQMNVLSLVLVQQNGNKPFNIQQAIPSPLEAWVELYPSQE